MTCYQSRKLLALTAFAIVMSLAGTSSAFALARGQITYPTVPYVGGAPLTGHGALREWQDETIQNNKLRQQMLLPSHKDKMAEATGIQGDGLKQWQDETVKNNAMRNRMYLPQQ
jgi:hypothetical protein